MEYQYIGVLENRKIHLDRAVSILIAPAEVVEGYLDAPAATRDPGGRDARDVGRGAEEVVVGVCLAGLVQQVLQVGRWVRWVEAAAAGASHRVAVGGRNASDPAERFENSVAVESVAIVTDK